MFAVASSAGIRSRSQEPACHLVLPRRSPFSSGGAASNIATSGIPIQAIGGPNAAFTLPSLNFGTVTDGQPVILVLHLVNNGDQSLAINLAVTSITGTNAADFLGDVHGHVVKSATLQRHGFHNRERHWAIPSDSDFAH